MFLVQCQFVETTLLLLMLRRTKRGNIRRTRVDLIKEHSLWVLEKSFYSTYRMSEAYFKLLLNMLRPGLERDNNCGRIEPAVRLGITIRFLAGASYLDVFHNFHCAKSTMYKVLSLSAALLWNELTCLMSF